MRHSYFLLLLLLTAACSKKSADDTGGQETQVLVRNGFEDLEGWVPNNPSLTKENPHSGQYSVKVDPAIEYSLTYINPIGHLSPTRINKIRLKAWTYQAKPGKAAVVVQINSPEPNGPSVFYQKFDLSEVSKWTELSQVLTMPAVLDPASQIRIYLWRFEAGGPAYMDDIELSVEP
ncbi:carbohydrate binding domain-containing protein [Hymenobacter cellulosivorans]|uniref:Carbohydrate binding domain-containing protein n=1 Tax=Hymenobacter cellulosivorans TaxID=2932249 RepID=A0ABY4FC85_9BACT|nr:carbohydrate binding domain-containing protein [Hymenobacter cellulosivorans]UOQ54279.1 carbohydrate binding domain-containing protein [Hymenobacter cellulosivorans]